MRNEKKTCLDDFVLLKWANVLYKLKYGEKVIFSFFCFAFCFVFYSQLRPFINASWCTRRTIIGYCHIPTMFTNNFSFFCLQFVVFFHNEFRFVPVSTLVGLIYTYFWQNDWLFFVCPTLWKWDLVKKNKEFD